MHPFVAVLSSHLVSHSLLHTCAVHIHQWAALHAPIGDSSSGSRPRPGNPLSPDPPDSPQFASLVPFSRDASALIAMPTAARPPSQEQALGEDFSRVLLISKDAYPLVQLLRKGKGKCF